MTADTALAAPIPLKVLIAGGFGAGKTTFVGAVSEIPPLRTEERLTAAGVGTDDVAGIEHKETTTVAMDFGRLTLADTHAVQLLLFGTPGQRRFWFMWDDLARGAVGALVLVDSRRLADCFAAVEFFESRQVPFVVVANHFHGAPAHTAEQIRRHVALGPDVPVLGCDARSTPSAVRTLIGLVDHALDRIPPAPAEA